MITFDIPTTPHWPGRKFLPGYSEPQLRSLRKAHQDVIQRTTVVVLGAEAFLAGGLVLHLITFGGTAAAAAAAAAAGTALAFKLEDRMKRIESEMRRRGISY